MCLSCTSKTKSKSWTGLGHLTIKEKSTFYARWWGHHKQHGRSWNQLVWDYWHQNWSTVAKIEEIWPISASKWRETTIGSEIWGVKTVTGGHGYRESHYPWENQSLNAHNKLAGFSFQLTRINQTNNKDYRLWLSHSQLKRKIDWVINRQRNFKFERWWNSCIYSSIKKQKL